MTTDEKPATDEGQAEIIDTHEWVNEMAQFVHKELLSSSVDKKNFGLLLIVVDHHGESAERTVLDVSLASLSLSPSDVNVLGHMLAALGDDSGNEDANDASDAAEEDAAFKGIDRSKAH